MKKYLIFFLIFLSGLTIAGCSWWRQEIPVTVHPRENTRTDSLLYELDLRAQTVDSLYQEIYKLGNTIDSLNLALNNCQGRLTIDPGFRLPDTLTFAGRLFDLRSERLQAKLQTIYEQELRSAHVFIPRSGKYFPLIDSIFAEYHIPADTRYLAIVESRLSPLAESKVGAVGMWQFMKKTATGFGLTVNDFIDERRHVVKATIAAARFLQSNYDYLASRGAPDWLLAMSAYNAGAGNIAKAMQEQGGKDFFDLIMKSDESHSFVWRAVATKIIFEHQEEIFGQPFELQTDLLQETRRVNLKLKGYYKIDDWARAQGTVVSRVWELNPWIKIYQRTRTQYSAVNDVVLPPGEFTILLPVDSEPDQSEAARLESGFLNENEGFFTHHVVKKGDTLYDIARKYRTSVANIKSLNGLNSNIIVPGQKLKLFGDAGSKGASGLYVVKQGDTIAQISRQLGVSMDRLIAANNLVSRNGVVIITPGQKLYY